MRIRTHYAFLALLSLLVLLVNGLVSAAAQSAAFGPVKVPGTSVIFDPDHVLSESQLESMSANLSGGDLTATPAVRVLAFHAAPGQTVTLSATGAIDCCNGTPHDAPDGYLPDVNIDSLGSISGYAGPGFAPLGVFTNGKPNGAAPVDVDYSGGTKRPSFSPRLNQVFFIGDGLTGSDSGSPQLFRVPDTATELWLGIADSYVDGTGAPSGYGDNTGSFSVKGRLDTCSAPAGPITSKTLATVPGIPDSRTCIGISESVVLTTEKPATWTVTSLTSVAGLASRTEKIDDPTHFPADRGLPSAMCDTSTLSETQRNTTLVCLPAPYVNDTLEVTATFEDGTSASRVFKVLEPDAVIFQRLLWPQNKPTSDYLFTGDTSRYQYGFSAGAFITPGNVSFAYIGISEHDADNPQGRFAPPFNLLFDVKGTKAWLATCDKVAGLKPADSHNTLTTPWVFSTFTKAHEQTFSLVQTGWKYVPDKEWSMWKGQIEELPVNEPDVKTAISASTAAELTVKYSSSPHPDNWLPSSNSAQCEIMIKNQFPLIH